MNVTIPTSQKRQVKDITDTIAEHLPQHDGTVVVFVAHTTAAITTADLDPGTDQDLLDALNGLLPKLSWRHPHNPAHAPDHLLSSIIGPSVTVPVQSGKMILGSWQRIILIEFDGPREREVIMQFTPSA